MTAMTLSEVRSGDRACDPALKPLQRLHMVAAFHPRQSGVQNIAEHFHSLY
jgi:hypothetical protein